ncbi:MAG: hypothetical protein HXS50_02160, partial [Theionarchaea archaeon]|nr:hypothetical protein [Theionarchaea archaeon]
MRARELAGALERIGHESTFVQPAPAPRPLRLEMVGAMARYVAAASRGTYDAI